MSVFPCGRCGWMPGHGCTCSASEPTQVRRAMRAVNGYAEYASAVAAYQIDHPAQRAGQAHFNVLHRLHPDLANEIRGDSMFDPFHVDERLSAFLGFVKLRMAVAA